MTDLDHRPGAHATYPLPKPKLRGWSHVVAAVVMAVLGVVIIVVANATAAQRTWLAVYVVGVVGMFTVSALYHRVHWGPRGYAFMKRLDHSTIFLAIAGTYTPIAAVCLEGTPRTLMLVTVWSGAAIGVALQWIPTHVPRVLSTLVYVVVGWAAALALPQLIDGMGWTGFALVLAGGVLYTLGAVVYALKWPDPWPNVFGFHEVFHACVVAAAGLHLAAVAFAVLPRM
jgi:hemolysin III